ncbi:hypothetical protein GCM10029992_27110 [Glycomyces albus]
MGSSPSHVAKTAIPRVAIRNDGSATSAATATPLGRPLLPSAARSRDGTQAAAAIATVTASAAPMTVAETPKAGMTVSATGRPVIQEVPRSPRKRPPNQSRRSGAGPASRPISARIASSVSGVGSRPG